MPDRGLHIVPDRISGANIEFQDSEEAFFPLQTTNCPRMIKGQLKISSATNYGYF